jgi:glycosyltransferase involved in cell wall biosynthesis
MRILMLGDSPLIHTGFGVVGRVAYDALLAEGHELIVLGGQDKRDPADIKVPGNVLYIPMHPKFNQSDLLGWAMAPKVIEEYQPDAINIVGDCAMTATWLLHSEINSRPIHAYMPVEGAPLNKIWTRSFLEYEKTLTITTCTHYGVEVLRQSGIDAGFAYHGVENLDFYPMTIDQRQDIRYRVNWTDRFVVMCVAQNVRRKQWPRLMEAIRLLKKRYPNILLYAHTVPFNNYWLDGHDLTQVAENMGIIDNIIFNPAHTRHNASIPVNGDGKTPGLAELYNAADCFVLPSQVEGFGLPLAEAMASGLPVITTNYAAQAEVVGKAGILIDPYDWEVNKSCSVYGNLNPADIAQQIERLIKSPELRKQLARKGVERAKDFRWDDYRKTLVEYYAQEIPVLTEAERKALAQVHPLAAPSGGESGPKVLVEE